MVQNGTVDDLFDIPDDIVKSVKEKIGEDEARLRHIEELVRKWIQSERYLPENYDEKMVRNFIRGSKFSLEITKRKLEGYFLAKYAFPEFYQNRDPTSADISKMIDVANIVRLPKLTQNGERICILSLADPDPANFDLIAALKLFWMLFDLTLTAKLPITGEILIFDCTNSTSGHIAKYLCSGFRNSLSIIRDAYAVRLNRIHFINSPQMVETVISIIRPLIHEKVRQRFTFHKSADSLVEFLEPDVLPSDFGGNLQCLEYYKKQWNEVLIKNSDWFRKQETVKINGKPSKRIEKFTSNTGLEGSFRQLNID